MMKKKTTKILLTHRFFYPDSPTYGYILEDIRQNLENEGYQVDVLSSKPSYRDSDKRTNKKIIEHQKNGSIIYRLPIFRMKQKKLEKILNYFWFPFIAFFFQVFSRRYDIVTVATTPPVIYPFITALASKIRRRKLIYHIMDIHPEIGRLSGEFKNKYIFNILKWMDNFTCKSASRIIVLSSDMKKVFVERDKNLENKLEIINNYDVVSEEVFTNDFFIKNKDKKKVVFAGNIGRFQNLESFILALKKYGSPTNFELIFVGEGSALKNLKIIAAPLGESVRFVPHQSISVARKIIAEADIGIVSLENEIIKYAYPSKTMTYLAEGTAILVCVDGDSELSRFVELEKIGISVEPSDLYNIHKIFDELSKGRISFEKSHVKNTFKKHFSKKIFDKQIVVLINKIVEEK